MVRRIIRRGRQKEANEMKGDKRSEKVYLPSKHDIARACEKIQEGWSERERLKRMGRTEKEHWLPPLVQADSIFPEGMSQTSDSTYG